MIHKNQQQQRIATILLFSSFLKFKELIKELKSSFSDKIYFKAFKEA